MQAQGASSMRPPTTNRWVAGVADDEDVRRWRLPERPESTQAGSAIDIAPARAPRLGAPRASVRTAAVPSNGSVVGRYELRRRGRD